MPRKIGKRRIQYGLFATPLEELIEPDSEVRVIDALVDRLDLVELGFTRTQVKQYGSASYDPSKLLNLYRYGYLNRIHSSRLSKLREVYRTDTILTLMRVSFAAPAGSLRGCYAVPTVTASLRVGNTDAFGQHKSKPTSSEVLTLASGINSNHIPFC